MEIIAGSVASTGSVVQEVATGPIHLRLVPIRRLEGAGQLLGGTAISSLEEEKAFFSGLVIEVSAKVRAIMQMHGGSLLDQNGSNERLRECFSLEAVIGCLGGVDTVLWRTFRVICSDNEWRELVASQDAITRADAAVVRAARLEREIRVLDTARRNVEVLIASAEPPSALISDCVTGMQDLIAKVREGTPVRRRAVAICHFNMESVRVPARDEQEEVNEGEDYGESAELQKQKKRGRSESKEKSAKKKTSREQQVHERLEAQVNDVEVIVDRMELEQPEVTLLSQIEESVEGVTQMLQEYFAAEKSNFAVPIGDVEIPDVSFADPAALEDRLDVVCQLLEDGYVEDSKVEQWGSLMRFWRLVNRSFIIVAIFAQLESTQARGRTTLKDRYEKKVQTLKCANAVRYTQATAYRKIGRFLLEYPRFIYQNLLVSVNDWSGSLDELQRSLTGDASSMWKSTLVFGSSASSDGSMVSLSSSDVEEEGEVGVCDFCRLPNRGILWTCEDCKELFHEICGGYDEGSLHETVSLHGRSEGVELKSFILCGRCLDNRDFTHAVAARRNREIVALGRFFNDPGCRFQLVIVPGDGYCLIGILERFAREHLGYTADADQFCRDLAQAAVESVEQTLQELSPVAVEQSSIDALKTLARAKVAVKRVKEGLWKKMEAQQLLRGYADFLFPNQVVVHSYQTTDDGRVGESGRYGEAGKDLYVLQWNTLPHYDLLIKK